MEQPSFELARLDFQLNARSSIDDPDLDAGLTNAVAQLGSQIPLQLFTAELLDAREQRTNRQLSASFGEQSGLLPDFVFRIAFAHLHLIGASIVAHRGQQQLFAHSPEAEQSDSELTLHALGTV